jgi:lipoprotein-releasing system ATP-binding protein
MSEEKVLLKGINIKREYKAGKKKLDVLKGINISIMEGNVHTIFGPSGAGKSTLIHILGGLDRPTEGEVIMDDCNLYDYPDKELAKIRNKKVGFVFQFYHLLPEFTAHENVMMPCAIDGHNGNEMAERAKRLLEKVGLSNRLNHKPNELSGGEKQRVAVARALVNNPSVIFADEPTGNLDRKNSEKLLDLLLELNRDKKITIVFVTHNEEIARKVGNIIRLIDGKIKEDRK